MLFFTGDVVSWNITYAGKYYNLVGKIERLTSDQRRPYYVVTVDGGEYTPWPHMLKLVSRRMDSIKEGVSHARTESQEGRGDPYR